MSKTPDELALEAIPEDLVITSEARTPEFDPTMGVPLSLSFPDDPALQPPNRLVVIGDSLSHGFQSGAIYNTDISYPAIIAYELGWFDDYRYPRYPGPGGGIPVNIEYLLRDLEKHYGSEVKWWEVPGAIFHARELMDQVEDYWERGAGSLIPVPAEIVHDLAIYGWDLRDALEKTFTSCHDAVKPPSDGLFKQIVENSSERAALRVYPSGEDDANDTLFSAAAKLGGALGGGADAQPGIETLVVFLGANNALQTVTTLKVRWSQDEGYQDLKAKGAYTVWQPKHFRSELDRVVEQVKKIKARHVIWCTVPHVTVVPLAMGIGKKIKEGSRYYPYYTRPWIDTDRFNPNQDPNITGEQARAIDSAIDEYNDAITAAVRDARQTTAEAIAANAQLDSTNTFDWYLLDIAGVLDRLASRRYIDDVNARPAWWTRYPLPAALTALSPTPDSRFLASDGKGGRGCGGLFALDGVHPTTVGYGLIAQEMINIMRRAGVKFHSPVTGAPRPDPVSVDFDRLIRRDTLILSPPQNLTPELATLAWADETLDLIKQALRL